jgi:hypothetical protein
VLLVGRGLVGLDGLVGVDVRRAVRLAEVAAELSGELQLHVRVAGQARGDVLGLQLDDVAVLDGDEAREVARAVAHPGHGDLGELLAGQLDDVAVRLAVVDQDLLAADVGQLGEVRLGQVGVHDHAARDAVDGVVPVDLELVVQQGVEAHHHHVAARVAHVGGAGGLVGVEALRADDHVAAVLDDALDLAADDDVGGRQLGGPVVQVEARDGQETVVGVLGDAVDTVEGVGQLGDVLDVALTEAEGEHGVGTDVGDDGQLAVAQPDGGDVVGVELTRVDLDVAVQVEGGGPVSDGGEKEKHVAIKTSYVQCAS